MQVQAVHIKLFEQLKGDYDLYIRSKRKISPKEEEEIYNIWKTIESKMQDVELISKKYTSQEYKENFFRELKTLFDESGFKAMVSKIWFYSYFKNISEILKQIDNLTNQDCDLSWVPIENMSVFKSDLRNDIYQIENCNFNQLIKLEVDFAPTSLYQEMSIAGGWTKEYHKLAEQFDHLNDILKNNVNPAIKKTWWKFWK